MRAASPAGPPATPSSTAHCLEVLESIQMGDRAGFTTPASWVARGARGSRWARAALAPVDQYTLPCCWPAPERARTEEKGNPAAAMLPRSRSTAAKYWG